MFDKPGRFKMKYQDKESRFNVIKDTETGVQYLYSYDIGLTVLVDKDGKPLIDNN